MQFATRIVHARLFNSFTYTSQIISVPLSNEHVNQSATHASKECTKENFPSSSKVGEYVKKLVNKKEYDKVFKVFTQLDSIFRNNLPLQHQVLTYLSKKRAMHLFNVFSDRFGCSNKGLNIKIRMFTKARITFPIQEFLAFYVGESNWNEKIKIPQYAQMIDPQNMEAIVQNIARTKNIPGMQIISPILDMEPSVMTHNCTFEVVSFYATQDINIALRIARQVKETSPRLYFPILNELRYRRRFKECRYVLQEIVQSGFKLDRIVCCEILEAAIRAKQFQEADNILSIMEENSLDTIKQAANLKLSLLIKGSPSKLVQNIEYMIENRYKLETASCVSIYRYLTARKQFSSVIELWKRLDREMSFEVVKAVCYSVIGAHDVSTLKCLLPAIETNFSREQSGKLYISMAIACEKENPDFILDFLEIIASNRFLRESNNFLLYEIYSRLWNPLQQYFQNDVEGCIAVEQCWAYRHKLLSNLSKPTFALEYVKYLMEDGKENLAKNVFRIAKEYKLFPQGMVMPYVKPSIQTPMVEISVSEFEKEIEKTKAKFIKGEKSNLRLLIARAFQSMGEGIVLEILTRQFPFHKKSIESVFQKYERAK